MVGVVVSTATSQYKLPGSNPFSSHLSRRKLMDGQYQPRADASPVEMELHEEKQRTTTQNFAIKSHKTWHQCYLSPLVNFRVISHVLPLVLSPRAMRNRNMCSITPTVWGCFGCQVKKCEANSSSPAPAFTQYMIHSRGKYCESTHLFLQV